MGNVQAIPVVGELATLAEGAGKAIAAGACAAVGQTDAASQLIQGAGQTFVNYSEVNAIAANVHMAVAAGCGDDAKVKHLQERQGQAWVDIGENTPVVGHGIGIARYATGDVEGGNRCMIGASRSVAVVAATVATGGVAGAVVCGAAAAGTGLVYDGVATGFNTLGQNKFAPVGFVAGVDRAVKTGDANDAFDTAAIPVVDGVAGALHGRGAARARKAAAAGAARAAPAAEVAAEAAGRPRRPSVPENYRPYGEVPGAKPQIPLANVKGNVRTAAFVKEFSNPADAMRGLEMGHGYDFVRMQDGTMRVIKHADAKKVGRILGDTKRRVGHTSLVEPGTEVVAAGEIYVGPTGNIESINSQSGHFQVPLDVMREQIGRAFPQSAIAHTSPNVFTKLCGGSVFKKFPHVAVYGPNFLVVLDAAVTKPLASITFILAYHEDTAVKFIAFVDSDKTQAKEAYNAVSLDFAKVLVRMKPSPEVLLRHGTDEFVNMCINQVRQINTVFPGGSWLQTSKDIESCFDSDSGSFRMRCRCRTFHDQWVENTILFQPVDRFENRDGTLVKLH